MVRQRISILAISLCLFGAGIAVDAVPLNFAQSPAKDADKDRLDDLVQQLGHDEFAKRQAASKALEALGEPALGALRKAAKSSGSAEIRRRAQQLVEVIEPKPVRLTSHHFSPGLPLAESKHPVCLISFVGQANTKGEGKGKLELIVTPPNFDEYGDIVTGTEVDNKARPQRNERPAVVLDCTIEYVKSGSIGRVNMGAVNRSVYSIKGPKITSALFVATPGPGLTSGRLLVLDSDKRVEYVVELADLTPRPGTGGGGLAIPCHPGCFPPGTQVRIPGGTKPIELIRTGDLVTSIDADGKTSSVKVTDIFVTRNRLLEVRTQDAKLITTQTQPIALEAGGYRPAGELRVGDRIWRLVNGERRAAKVIAVSGADREDQVFNLVLGGIKGFVAEDFLVRSKPPAENR